MPLPAKTAVLLVNLGTPEAPTAAALRPWLAEILFDSRVIDVRPRWWWWLILHALILRLRPRRSARAYAKIWLDEGSPLRVLSQQVANELSDTLARRCQTPVVVKLAMRYGRPSVADTISELTKAGARRLLVLPMYPQYSATSSGSVIDAVTDSFKHLRWPPELRIINDYHDDTGYLAALADSVHRYWQTHGRSERLLLSFHGIPQRYVQLGDPYLEQCRATAAGLRERLGLDERSAPISFQSRVGRKTWLQPYTHASVRNLAKEGIRKLDIICPGFAVDCLETLEEIAMRNRKAFFAAGGGELRYIPALNSNPQYISALADMVIRNIGDWARP